MSSEPAPEPLRRRLRAEALRALTQAAGVLPEPLLRSSLRPFSAWGVASSHGRRTRQNLELALGAELDEKHREQIARAVFRHAQRQVAEWLRLAAGAAPDSTRGAWIEERVQLDASVERLEQQLTLGRGALIVTAHHGNWELLAAALRRRGFQGYVIGQKRARDSTRDWLVHMRRAYGVETLPQDCPARRPLEVLRSGAVLGVLCDLEVRRLDGEFLPFFGTPALTMTAPAALARAAKAPLLPIRCTLEGATIEERSRLQAYTVRVDEPLTWEDALPKREASLELLTRLNACFETWIRQAPEQWSWHQPRWRTRPGEYEAKPLGGR